MNNEEPIIIVIDYGALRWTRESDGGITLLHKNGEVLGWWS